MLEQHDSWMSPSEALNEFQPGELQAPGGQDAATAATGERARYGFRAGGIGLLIDPDTVSEVIDPLPVSALPNTPVWLAGLINLRGNLVPVFDLLTLLDLSRSPDDHARRILILGEGERAAGILIDSLPEAPALGRRLNSLPPLPSRLSEHVIDAYLSQNFVWLEFQHHSFFASLSKQIAAQ